MKPGRKLPAWRRRLRTLIRSCAAYEVGTPASKYSCACGSGPCMRHSEDSVAIMRQELNEARAEAASLEKQVVDADQELRRLRGAILNAEAVAVLVACCTQHGARAGVRWCKQSW